MDVEFEILAILATAFLFTITGFILENLKQTVTLKLLAMIAWFSLAFSFTASTPSFVAFSMLFLGIGIIMAVEAVIDALDMLSEKRGKSFTQSGWLE